MSEFLSKKVYEIFNKLQSLEDQIADLRTGAPGVLSSPSVSGVSPAPQAAAVPLIRIEKLERALEALKRTAQPDVPAITEDMKTRLGEMETELRKMQQENQKKAAESPKPKDENADIKRIDAEINGAISQVDRKWKELLDQFKSETETKIETYIQKSSQEDNVLQARVEDLSQEISASLHNIRGELQSRCQHLRDKVENLQELLEDFKSQEPSPSQEKIGELKNQLEAIQQKALRETGALQKKFEEMISLRLIPLEEEFLPKLTRLEKRLTEYEAKANLDAAESLGVDKENSSDRAVPSSHNNEELWSAIDGLEDRIEELISNTSKVVLTMHSKMKSQIKSLESQLKQDS